MSAWIMLGSGCFFAVLGVLTLRGRGTAEYARSPRAGWGRIAMGGGSVLDGGPRLLDFSSGAETVSPPLLWGSSCSARRFSSRRSVRQGSSCWRCKLSGVRYSPARATVKWATDV